jgi:hypothetical protein
VQADASTTRKYGGTGLGLTISAQLVELMDGRLWLDSEPGKGSCFHFVVRLDTDREATTTDPTLSSAAPGSIDRHPPATSPAARQHLRVLVAEDNATNQKLVVELLRQHGCRVSVVDNGHAAVDRALREPFDVILMDVQMPEMSGIEATSAIRQGERAQGRRTPIIALTARAMAGDREQCFAAGMDGYVAKPLRPDALFTAIDGLSTSAVSQDGASAPGDGHGSIDLSALVAGFGGRRALVRDVVDVFLEDVPGMLGRLATAAQSRDSTGVAAAAHAIKGSVGLFSQGEAYESAKRVEQLGRAGDLEEIDSARRIMEDQVARLTVELRALRQTLSPPANS